MILYPAIDIQNGNVVRLKQGKKDHGSVFDSDPVKMALHWQKTGAQWLHVVNLDGAFDANDANSSTITRILGSVDIPVQLGGGIRSLDSCKKFFNAGVTRLIIGTVALEQPDLFKKMCQNWPGKIGVSLDAVNGRLKTRGWEHDSGLNIFDVLLNLENAGAAFIIYTDITRDGMHTGLNFHSLERLLQNVSMPVIAAGGVSTMKDIREAWMLAQKYALDGVICGRALYENTLNLSEALTWLKMQTEITR